MLVGQAPKGLDDQRPSPYVKRWRTLELNAATNEYEIKHHARPMTAEEVQIERDLVPRASSSTNKYGAKNGTPAGPKKTVTK